MHISMRPIQLGRKNREESCKGDIEDDREHVFLPDGTVGSSEL